MEQFKGDGGRGHMANFIAAVRSRKESELHAPVTNGHLSAGLMHIANASQRIGKQVEPNELRERMQDDKHAMDAIERYSEQMKAWDIDYKKEPWTCGVSMAFDPKAEKFTGPMARKANAYLKRKDRKPFVVPEIKAG